VRAKLPRVSTSEVTGIEPVSAVSGGNVTSDGNTNLLVRGVCWSTSKSPDLGDFRTTDGYGTGEFTSILTGLEPNTQYYVRAYATNEIGTAYGSQVTFTTSQISVPVITTNSVSDITQSSAVCGGNIASDGGTEVTQRGVCWSTSSGPTIDYDMFTEDGNGTGSFTSNITGLTGNRKYYVRAYAINSEGIAYGQELPFTTSPVLPVISTVAPLPTSTSTATSGGIITNDGGSQITERGVCWSLTSNPTIQDSRTTDGEGTGSFTSNITGLSENRIYHVRAYATTAVGTSYGTDMTFRTDPSTVTDYDGNVYNIIRIGSQLWFKENLKTTSFADGTPIPLVSTGAGWGGLTTPGYCWYNNNSANKDVYGALYNWYTVETGSLCPSGWRVPTDDDCLDLEKYDNNIGGKLKEVGTDHWTPPNTGASDAYGFTALPGGYRTAGGLFGNINDHGYWWTSSGYSGSDAWARRLQHDSEKTFRHLTDKKIGKSIRCMRD